MAELYLATQSGVAGFERTVVLKRILPALSGDPQFRNMLVDEALIAMSLTHGNIVQVLDLGCAGTRYFLVMELVDGWDLATIFTRARAAQKPMPTELCLYILAQVCRGLFYAHTRQREGRPLDIVHRDVSPQNVLISEQGEVKVTDFGIAKAFGRRERTQTGIIKGKLDFMSPEQASGAPLDARSDIFSAGSVLYLLTTGQLPFAGNTQMEIMLRIQGAEAIPLQQAAPLLDGGTRGIIQRAMALDPADRYENAEQMMFEIERVLRTTGRPVGQSDLKVWLDDLAKRDGGVPISRQPALPMEEDNAEQLSVGASFALDDTSGVSRLADAATAMNVAVAPVARVATPMPFHVPDSVTYIPVPVLARTGWLGRMAKFAFWMSVLLAVGAGILYKAWPETWQRLVTRGEMIAETAQTRILDEMRDDEAGAERTAKKKPRVVAAPSTIEDTRPSKAPPKEVRAVSDPTPTPLAKRVASPAAAKAKRVVVDVVSVPAAARVRRSSGEDLGFTPTRLVAEPGDRVELQISKPGYAPITRTVVVRAGGGRLQVRLVKAKP